MKRKIQIILFIALSLLLITNCSKKDDTTEPSTNNNNSGNTKEIKLNVSGTVSYTYNSTNYSLNVDSVTWTNSNKTYITIYSHNADPYSSMLINAYDLDGVKSSKDYTASSSNPFAIITAYINDGIYQAANIYSNSSCTVNFSEISSTAIKGTFSGTLALASTNSNSSVTITLGTINITVK